MLSLLISLPVVIALVLILTPTQQRVFQAVTAGTALIQLVIVMLIYSNFNPAISFQYIEKYSWIDFSLGHWGNFTAYYWIGVDGLSLPLVFLSTIIFFIASLSSWNVKHNIKGYFILLLILNSA